MAIHLTQEQQYFIYSSTNKSWFVTYPSVMHPSSVSMLTFQLYSQYIYTLHITVY
jgi:hypothetical protein